MDDHKSISIAEFFEKNRHLLGFDSLTKALLTTIKEAVDNSLDACEESDILPEIYVQIFDAGNKKYKVVIEDNGPGLKPEIVTKAFGKLLYGSKFHKLRQSRGQQGIGISAAVLYAQLTSGKPAKIISKTEDMAEAYYCKLMINTKNNEPEIISNDRKAWEKEHGLRIELELEADYSRSAKAIESYLRQTAIVNPHASIFYITPKMEQFVFARVVEELPPKAKEIKPHPYGVELGRFIKMIQDDDTKTVISFLQDNFSKVGKTIAMNVCSKAKVDPTLDIHKLERNEIERLYRALQNEPIAMPPTDCLVPITADKFEKGLRKEIDAEHFVTISRKPSVYRGNPFIVEIGLAYGGNIGKSGEAMVLRFANRVPLLFQKGACAITRAIKEMNWKAYGFDQPSGSLPQGNLVIAVHIASVWVPFTSEAKEAIAHYPEIIKEVKLALQEGARKIARYVKKKKSIGLELKRREFLKTYIMHLTDAMQEILEFNDSDKMLLTNNLNTLLEKIRGKVETIETKNEDYEGAEIVSDLEQFED